MITVKAKLNQRTTFFLLAGLFITVFSGHPLYAQENVTGQTWLDLNLNGQIDEGEKGLGGVIVLGQDDTDLLLETVTAEDGSWELGPFSGERIRIQFELPQDGPLADYRSSQAGWNSVQSISLASEVGKVNAGFYSPSDYCLANPELATTRFSAGNPQSTEEFGGSVLGEFTSLFAFPYDSVGGESSSDDYSSPASLLENRETGAVWGLAWDGSGQKLYTSAFVKRHAGFGPLGLGGIYVVDLSVGQSTSEFIDLVAAGVDLGDVPPRELPGDQEAPSVDGGTFAAVGKTGLGGMDVSADGKTLYVMNLGARELISIDTESAQVVGQIPIPELGCTNGVARPFAVKIAADGNLYAGAVCSAENGGTADDLIAHILQLNGTQFSSLFSFPLAPFQRGELTGGFASGEWRPWIDEWVEDQAYAVPIVSDIEFDDDGSIIVAIMDRTGHMAGKQQPSPTDLEASDLFSKASGGDVIRICQVDGDYILEGDINQCPYNSLPGAIGGDEFYTGEQFDPNFETSLGGIALLPNRGEVAVAVAAPFEYTTAGIRWLDNETGKDVRGYEVSPGRFYYFGSANGLGDVEVICRGAPVDVGSRIWRDINENGLLDAGEPSLPNIEVELYDVDRELTLDTVISDADGRFWFSSSFGIDDDSKAHSLIFQKETNYQLRIEVSQEILDGLMVTEQNGEAADWMIDSDARLAESYFVADFRINIDDGALSHIDIGFKLQPQVEESGNESEGTAAASDPLQPPSNVVGSNPDLANQTSNNDEGLIPDVLYGIPIDLSSRLFLAVGGLVSGGIIAIIVGLLGLIWTFIRIRRHKKSS